MSTKNCQLCLDRMNDKISDEVYKEHLKVHDQSKKKEVKMVECTSCKKIKESFLIDDNHMCVGCTYWRQYDWNKHETYIKLPKFGKNALGFKY